MFGDEIENKVAAKRSKLVTEQRQQRTQEITEDIQSVSDTVKLLELQRGKFVTAERYLQAAEVVKQITECRAKKRKLQTELAKLQTADARSKKYQKRKSARKSEQTVATSTISFSKGAHVASKSGRSSGSTSTETESGDVDMQEDLRSENCRQDQSTSSPNDRGRKQTTDMVAVRTSEGPIMSSTSGRPCETISTETKVGDVSVQENFHGGSEDCSASIPKCQQTGSLQTNQGQDDQSVDEVFSKAPQTV